MLPATGLQSADRNQRERCVLRCLVSPGDNGSLKARHVFFVRVSRENPAQQAGLAGNRLDRQNVLCEHQPPQAGAVAMLSTDLYGHLNY